MQFEDFLGLIDIKKGLVGVLVNILDMVSEIT